MTPPSYSSLKALFKPGKYDPRCTDLERWIRNLEKIFNAKGTPAIERPRLAFENIKEEFKSQIKFENWSEETQNGPGLIPSEKWGEPERTGTTVDRSRSRSIWFAKGHRSSFAVHLART